MIVCNIGIKAKYCPQNAVFGRWTFFSAICPPLFVILFQIKKNGTGFSQLSMQKLSPTNKSHLMKLSESCFLCLSNFIQLFTTCYRNCRTPYTCSYTYIRYNMQIYPLYMTCYSVQRPLSLVEHMLVGIFRSQCTLLVNTEFKK